MSESIPYQPNIPAGSDPSSNPIPVADSNPLPVSVQGPQSVPAQPQVQAQVQQPQVQPVQSPVSQVTQQSPLPQPQTSVIQTSGVQYVGFGRRLIANIIDSFVVGIINFIVSFSIGFVFGFMNLMVVGTVLSFMVSVIAGYGYYIYFLVSRGATLGKMALGIKVITVSGEPLTVGRVILREVVGKWISALVLGIGYLSIIFDQKKQGWHDKIAGTLVVHAS